jgi:hypothetical protein
MSLASHKTVDSHVGITDAKELKTFWWHENPSISSEIIREGTWKGMNTRGPFEKFVDSPCYSESELCGGAVTVSFSMHLL